MGIFVSSLDCARDGVCGSLVSLVLTVTLHERGICLAKADLVIIVFPQDRQGTVCSALLKVVDGARCTLCIQTVFWLATERQGA